MTKKLARNILIWVWWQAFKRITELIKYHCTMCYGADPDDISIDIDVDKWGAHAYLWGVEPFKFHDGTDNDGPMVVYIRVLELI